MTGYESKRAAAQDKLDSMEREALKLALEEYLCREMPAGTVIGDPKFWVPRIATAIKEALEQPAQEPVTMLFGSLPVYDTTPPQRTWVDLTDEDCKGMSAGDRVVAMWAARTLKERNA